MKKISVVDFDHPGWYTLPGGSVICNVPRVIEWVIVWDFGMFTARAVLL